MNEVLDADDAVAPELLLDEVVGCNWSPLAVDLEEKIYVLLNIHSF